MTERRQVVPPPRNPVPSAIHAVGFRLLALIALPVDHRAPMEKYKVRRLIVLFLSAVFISRIATAANPAFARALADTV